MVLCSIGLQIDIVSPTQPNQPVSATGGASNN